jgi:hypothetical protein
MTAAALVETLASPVGLSVWPRFPSLYEISTWVWLADRSMKHGRQVDLSSVPSAEWDAIAAYGFDEVWLMGVWERSPAGIAIANQNNGSRIFIARSGIFGPKTTLDRLIVCGTTALTNISAARRASQSRERSFQSVG